MSMDAEAEEYHVLAVDDSIIDRKLIERLLKTSSYQVTTVDSGDKALKFLGLREEEEEEDQTTSSSGSSSDSTSVSPNNRHHQEVEVNLIITDYCMPGMTGYDLLKKIKESINLRDIPVVIMSSENVPARISRCLEEGAEEFLLKPLRLADVKKLKPHMMKTKQLKQQQKQDIKKEQEEESEPRMGETTVLRPQPQSNSSSSNNNNKRKVEEQGLSPDSRRMSLRKLMREFEDVTPNLTQGRPNPT